MGLSTSQVDSNTNQLDWIRVLRKRTATFSSLKLEPKRKRFESPTSTLTGTK